MIWKCESCDRSLRVPDGTTRVSCHCVHAEPKPRDPFECVHFLGGTDESTEAGGRCGCSSATPLITVCECELHGRCTATMSSKDESIAWCMGCRDFSTT